MVDFYWHYIGLILDLCWGYFGIMENRNYYIRVYIHTHIYIYIYMQGVLQGMVIAAILLVSRTVIMPGNYPSSSFIVRSSVSDVAKCMSADNLQACPLRRAAVKGLHLRYYIKETLVFTIHTHYGDSTLNLSSLTAKDGVSAGLGSQPAVFSGVQAQAPTRGMGFTKSDLQGFRV